MPSDLVKKLDRTISAFQRVKGVTPPNRAERQKRMAAMQKVLDRHGIAFLADATRMGAGSYGHAALKKAHDPILQASKEIELRHAEMGRDSQKK